MKTQRVIKTHCRGAGRRLARPVKGKHKLRHGTISKVRKLVSCPWRTIRHRQCLTRLCLPPSRKHLRSKTWKRTKRAMKTQERRKHVKNGGGKCLSLRIETRKTLIWALARAGLRTRKTSGIVR